MIGLAKAQMAAKPVTPIGNELGRLLHLEQRDLPTAEDFEMLQDMYTEMLRAPAGPCECRTKYHRQCPTRLNPLQAWTLHEARTEGGIIGSIPVGGGKTLLDFLTPMVVPNCKVAVLLVPASLRAQAIDVNWPFYAQHWKLPNLAGADMRWRVSGRPVLHIKSYDSVSSKRDPRMLEDLKADAYILDEAHKVSNPTSARTIRLRREARKTGARVFAWSGTLLKNTIKDIAPLCADALKDGSPLPLYDALVDELSVHTDPVFDVDNFRKTSNRSSHTNWEKLLEPGDTDVRSAIFRRMKLTPGFITSSTNDDCTASLTIYGRQLAIPPRVQQLLRGIEKDAERPDGEVLFTALEKYACMSQMVSGFYYRWTFPNEEPQKLINEWKAARKAYFQEVRARVQLGHIDKDSLGLLYDAAKRWHEGYVHNNVTYPPYTKKGPLPVWNSMEWPTWRAVEDLVKPETETVWESDYLVKDIAKWVAEQEDPAILWYEHTALGVAIEKETKLVRYGGGPKASKEIIHESGTRSIIASINSHGTGKELQMFHNQLICNVPSSGSEWEQLLGRMHRRGQLSDEVLATVYTHCAFYKDALQKAQTKAAFLQEGLTTAQKLISKAEIIL